MNALITGGSGFIGSWLSEYLLLLGHHVTIIDNLSTGNKQNLTDIKNHPNCTFIEGDYGNPASYNEIIQYTDQLYHLASPVGVRLIVNELNADQIIQNHLTSTRLLYEAAGMHGVEVFFASSSEVYGKRLDVYPQERSDGLREQMNGVWGAIDKTRWWYAHLKTCSEDLLLEYTKSGKLEGTIGRFFNVTGPRQRPDFGMVVPRFIQKAVAGLPITVYGEGRQVRSFCYVNEAVKAMVQLMQHLDQTNGQIYNIGKVEPVTIFELAKTINEITGNKQDIELIPLEDAFDDTFEEIYYRIPNTDKLQKLRGTAFKYSLENIIIEMVKTYKDKQENRMLN